MSRIGIYDSGPWRRVREKVMEHCHWECQICREKYHRHRRAELVHHIYHLDAYPQYGLMEYVEIGGERRRNLIAVCKECHEVECHPERLRKAKPQAPPVTEERW